MLVQSNLNTFALAVTGLGVDILVPFLLLPRQATQYITVWRRCTDHLPCMAPSLSGTSLAWQLPLDDSHFPERLALWVVLTGSVRAWQ